MKNNKGITLVTLVITIIVLAIIASITVYSGLDIVKRANLETMRSNMLLIQAKTKEYAEEANFKAGPGANYEKKSETENSVFTEYGLEKAGSAGISTIGGESANEYWLVTDTALSRMGLSNISEELKSGENYLVNVDITNVNVEVYNTLGYQGHYSLSELEELQ